MVNHELEERLLRDREEAMVVSAERVGFYTHGADEKDSLIGPDMGASPESPPLTPLQPRTLWRGQHPFPFVLSFAWLLFRTGLPFEGGIVPTVEIAQTRRTVRVRLAL